MRYSPAVIIVAMALRSAHRPHDGVPTHTPVLTLPDGVTSAAPTITDQNGAGACDNRGFLEHVQPETSGGMQAGQTAPTEALTRAP